MQKARKAERVKEVAHYMIDNPGCTQLEMAHAMGLNPVTLNRYFHSSELLSALKDSSSKRILGMLPLAVKGFRDSLTTKNEKIKYFASKDLLQTEKILGPERIDVTIQDNSNRTVEELQALIQDAQKIPAPTIDAELIGE